MMICRCRLPHRPPPSQDGDMLVNPIEFHVLVNRLHGAMEGAKEKLRDGITKKQWDAGFEAEMARIKVRRVHAMRCDAL